MNTIIHPRELLLLKNAAPLIGLIQIDADFQINNFVFDEVQEHKPGILIQYLQKFRKVIYLMHELYSGKSLETETADCAIVNPLADIAIIIIKVLNWILLFFVFLLILALVAAIFEGIYILEMNPLLMVLIIAAIPVSLIALYTFVTAVVINEQAEVTADLLPETISETAFA
jgi:hypothetical protein